MSDRRDVRRVLDHDRFRKKREDDTISIRKQKREDLNLKRRKEVAPSMESLAGDAEVQMMGAAPGAMGGSALTAPAQSVAVLAKMPVDGYDKVANPSPAELIAAFQSPNPADHLKAAHHIRRILSLGLFFLNLMLS